MMKSTFTKDLVLIILTSAILLQVHAQDIYVEDFDPIENWSGGTAGSYNEKTYMNSADPQNDAFFSDNAVRESSNTISGYAWRLKNEGNPIFRYACSEPVYGFSVYLAHWNVDIPLEISIECSVNSGVSFSLVETLDSDWWISQGLGDKEFQEFISGNLDLSPGTGEQVIIRLTTNGSERLLIDNFQLQYNNASAGVEDPLEFTATTASESQINLIFVPNNASDDVVIVFNEEGLFEEPSGPPPASGLPFAGGTLFYSGTVSPQSHSGLMAEQTVFYKAWSYDGEAYSTGVTDQATTGVSSIPLNAWINEIHYDNDGADVDELIEIVVENAESVVQENIEVHLYNGSNGEVYATESLNNFEPGFITNNFFIYTWYFTGIQNGAPEGIALAINGELVPGQFLSYEGSFTAANGPAAGILSTDIGVEEPLTNPVGYSLQLSGAGIKYEHFTWESPAVNTPGDVNLLQEIGNFTFWTGAADQDWENGGNWTGGVPTSSSNAAIPEVSSPLNYFPVINQLVEVSTLVVDVDAVLEIDVQGALTVSGSFINSGTLNIRSDAEGTGSLIETNGVNANTERFVTEESWHHISSPVTALYSDVFEGWYLMDWDEPSESWNFIEELGVPLNAGMQGYSVWTDSPAILNFSGDLNSGPLSIELSLTEGTSGSGNDPSGYNLVGNPYASSLDWDIEDGSGWTRTNMALSIYYWNGTQYASYVMGGPNPGPNGGSNMIPPHQGFFVKCTQPSGGILAVNNEARVHSSQPFYKALSETGDFFRIKLQGTKLNDELLLGFNPNSSAGFDDNYDAYKLYGCEEAPQVYTIGADNSKLSINTLPGNQGIFEVPLGFRSGTPGMLELMVDEMNGNDTIPLFLEDMYEQLVIDFKLIGSYVFFSDTGTFEDRFRLLFSDEAIRIRQQSLQSLTPRVFTVDQMIIVTSIDKMNGNLVICDMYGREVVKTLLPDSDRLEIAMNGNCGFFIVRLITVDGMYTRKVYIPQ